MERVYWDTREYRGELPVEPPVYDVKVLYEWSSDLASLVRKVQPDGMGDFLDLDRRCTAYLTAAQEGKVDQTIPSLLIPEDLFWKYARARHVMAGTLFEMKDEVDVKRYDKSTYPALRSVRQVEKAGIHIDEALAQRVLKKGDLAVHERKFLQGTLDMIKRDGLVFSKITPVGTRTGRFGVEGGFQCMAIPHGVCRQVVNSRFEGGKILTFDFNAIDYRCLVSSLGDDYLREFYKGERDFHARTARFLSLDRDNTKKITYTHLYGGSRKTLRAQTLLTEEKIDFYLGLLDKLFAPIAAKRAEMANEARRSGFVFTPSGERVEVLKDDHDGKVVGLYAQRYSSEVFNRALATALKMTSFSKSKIIFTVHDEIVLDTSPDEQTLAEDMRVHIENETGFVVKLKRGQNYDEAT